tara:strand:- start:1469 stop:2494 length:1026 start_codon:yes stop_codon:yes gene_type:complete
MISDEKLEEIEEYYLSTICRYLGSDYKGLINKLENHNKTWDQWYPRFNKAKSKKSFFDTGAERVIYMLLNRGDILGEPNANPIGSDNSYLKYDESFNEYIAMNIDVKSIKANTALGDVLTNMPIGENQNSYESNIEYIVQNKIVEERHYEPGLDKIYQITDQHGVIRNYLTLSYSIVILYCDEPINAEPKRQKVIGVFVNCIPNLLLKKHYGNKVFDPGKSGNLVIKEGQKIFYSTTEYFISKGDEKIDHIIKKYKITYEDYCKYNGKRSIKWTVDARFNYLRNKFKLRNNSERIKKIFLNNDKFEHYFNFVDKNKERTKKINRQKNTKEAFDFLVKLDFF